MIPTYLKEHNFNNEKLYEFIEDYFIGYYEVNAEYLEYVFVKTRINYIHLLQIVNWSLGKINYLFENNCTKINDISNNKHNRFWNKHQKRMALFSLNCSQHLIQKFIKAKYWHDVKYIKDETLLDSERIAIFENTTSVEGDFASFYSTNVRDELDQIRKYLKSRCMPSRNKSVEQTIILNDDNLQSDSMNVLDKQKVNINNYTVAKKGKSKNNAVGNNNIKVDHNIFTNKNNNENKFDIEDQKNIDKLGYEKFKIDLEKDIESGKAEEIDEEGKKIKQSYWESVIHKSKLKDKYLNKHKKKYLDKKMKDEKRSETHSVKRQTRKKNSKKEEDDKGKKGNKKIKTGKTKWIEKIEEDVIDEESNLKGNVSYKENVVKTNTESNKDEKFTKNKKDLKSEEEKKFIKNEKKENDLQNTNIISKGRYIFISNNKYRRKRNYITMQAEIEEAKKNYKANLSLTENKVSKFSKKELGDLDSEDIEKILELEENEGKDNEKINKIEGFRTKILKSLQKEIGLPGETKNKNRIESKEKKKTTTI